MEIYLLKPFRKIQGIIKSGYDLSKVKVQSF